MAKSSKPSRFAKFNPPEERLSDNGISGKGTSPSKN
ncbi:hypothetical protein CCACVL1_21191 [Corchorus capsularis]|uniref:Uncharacterized protein n=1 Tax=Corchorus capsularis TaxID=210143 RepID=A0A1R3H7M6_COCAP|nr:hypothetical protein CCACVL1_21191 [Corchorus capsularis]